KTLKDDYEGRMAAAAPHLNGHPGSVLNGVNGMNGVNGVNGIHSTGPFGAANAHQISPKEKAELDEWRLLLARCYLKQGDWQVKLHNGD
ncbi:UNVERIFIED_CONTAM: hypothetical protein NY603_28515, partial [Bacteroidetes bacterium 56_B9]